MTRNPKKNGWVCRCLAAAAIFFSILNPARAGLWLTNNPMFVARTIASATLLQDGKILVAGGFGNNTATTAAEVYDPATGNWRQVGSLHTARVAHTATLLRNGKVLVAGGYNSTVQLGVSYLNSAELYDPVSETWTETGPLQTARAFSTATLLPDGTVLVAGGVDTYTNTATAELFDPATGSWTPTENLNEARAYHTATLLPDGRVMVSGGTSNGFNNPGTRSSIELYDATQGTWTLAGTMTQERLGHTATLLPNGEVLLAGGITNGPPQTPLSSAEIYDPLTGLSSPAGSMNSTRVYHTATLLPDGTVLVTGGITDQSGNLDSHGSATNSTEIYDPSIDTWTLTSPLDTPRFSHKAVLLPSGQILALGGSTNEDNPGLASTELFDPTIGPSAGSWTFTGSMQFPRAGFTATLLPNGQVLVAGGQNGNGPYYASCELYDPLVGTWTNTGPLNFGRFNHRATLLADGRVLVTGGIGDVPSPSVSEIYDPSSGIWATNGTMIGNPFANTATLLHNGKVLVAGYAGISTNSAQLFDPVSGTWTGTGPMLTPRIWHKAVLLPTGNVLVVGGQQGGSDLSSAEIYDTITGQWSEAGTTRASSYIFSAAGLLPSGKVLVAGIDTNASPVADLFDPATGAWNPTGAPLTNHFQPNLIVLPNGKALLIGEGANSEIYDPAVGQWSQTPAMNLDRQDERSVLLPDGRVLEIGGVATNGFTQTGTATAEVFDPGLYPTNAPRPQITSSTRSLNPGEPLTLTGTGFRGISGASGGSMQDSATDYPLVQLRSIENGQSAFLLATNWSTNSFTSLPVWNFPPGQALATVFVNGIQSTSGVVNITVPTPVVTTLANPQVSTNGALQFTFTNTPGTVLGVLATTNLTLPISSWTPLGGVTEISPGSFEFNDPQVTNFDQRFYQIFAP